MSLALYYTLLALCCIYAGLRGGAPERMGAAIVLIGSLLSTAARSAAGHRFGSVEFGILLVDIGTVIAFLALALWANRFWPLWITSLQILGIAGHAVKGVDPGTIPLAYAFILAFWSYPMLALIAVGTFNHQRRLKQFGADPPWSNPFGRSKSPPGGGPAA